MGDNFKPTHVVIKQEEGLFVFSVGEELQHIGDGFYKSFDGCRKHVVDEFLLALEATE